MNKNNILLTCIIVAIISWGTAIIRAQAFNNTYSAKTAVSLTSKTTGERGRVQIINNNVVADNGYPLRGEHIVMSDNSGSSLLDSYYFNDMYDMSRWYKIRDDYHLNTIRLLISRPPQNWSSDLGENCTPSSYRCLAFDYTMPNGKTMIEVLDDMVDTAASLGMYIIIDYHPVGGHITQDATDWWSVVAPRYANRTHVIYEAANEPVAWEPWAYTADDVQFEVDIYQHIRSLAPETHIILWTFANALPEMRAKVDEAPEINYTNTSVGFHPYDYADANVIELQNHYPAIASEIGAYRDSRTVSLENLNVSWIWLDGVWNFTPDIFVTLSSVTLSSIHLVNLSLHRLQRFLLIYRQINLQTGVSAFRRTPHRERKFL